MQKFVSHKVKIVVNTAKSVSNHTKHIIILLLESSIFLLFLKS
jgi:hypothetical protein